MAKYRNIRINEEVSRVLTETLRNVKDPRVSSQFITITSCNVSQDLKYAKVYYSLFDTSKENLKEVKAGLISATGYMRSCLAQTLNLRQTPELIFEYDDSVIQGNRINELLKEIKDERESRENKESEKTNR